MFSDEASHILTGPFILNAFLILFLLLSNGSCFVDGLEYGCVGHFNLNLLCVPRLVLK